MVRQQALGRTGTKGPTAPRPARVKRSSGQPTAKKSAGGIAAHAKGKAVAARVGRSPLLNFKPTKERFLELYAAPTLTRIAWAKGGVGARDAKAILGQLRVSQGDALAALRIPAATMNRKAKRNALLSPAEGERVLGVGRLLGQVQAMVQESGNPEGFDASAWLSDWMSAPVPALGGARPLDLMDTMTGQALVSQLLSQVQSGAYA